MLPMGSCVETCASRLALRHAGHTAADGLRVGNRISWKGTARIMNAGEVGRLRHRRVMAGLLTDALHSKGWHERT